MVDVMTHSLHSLQKGEKNQGRSELGCGQEKKKKRKKANTPDFFSAEHVCYSSDIGTVISYLT